MSVDTGDVEIFEISTFALNQAMAICSRAFRESSGDSYHAEQMALLKVYETIETIRRQELNPEVLAHHRWHTSGAPLRVVVPSIKTAG